MAGLEGEGLPWGADAQLHAICWALLSGRLQGMLWGVGAYTGSALPTLLITFTPRLGCCICRMLPMLLAGGMLSSCCCLHPELCTDA